MGLSLVPVAELPPGRYLRLGTRRMSRNYKGSWPDWVFPGVPHGNYDF